MRRYCPLILTYILVPAIASALPRGPRESHRILQRVDQQINVARDLSSLSPDAEADELLLKAEAKRAEALALIARNRHRQAIQKLTLALENVDRAIFLMSQYPLQRQRREVRRLIEQARDLAIEKPSSEAQRLLRSALKNEKQALAAIRERDSRTAMERFRLARFMAERCFSLLQSGPADKNSRLEQEKRRFEQLLERARDSIDECGDARAVELIDKAEQQYQQTLRAAASGNRRVALNLYHNTTRLLLRAIDICEGGRISDREQAAEQLELFEELLETVKEGVQREKDLLLVKRAERLHQQAQDAFGREQHALCLRRIELARNLISRLWAETPGLTLRQRAGQELAGLAGDIARMESGSDSLDQRSQALLRAAQLSLDDAEKHLARNRIQLALQAIFAGNRFLSAIATETSLKLEQDHIEKEMTRLFAELDQRGESRERDELFEEAEKMGRRARNSAQAGNYEVAHEYLKLGFDLIHTHQP